MPWAAAAAVVGAGISASASRSNASQAADAAAQTQQANLAANRVDQTTPFGSITWGTGANGQPTQTTTLSPAQQQLVDTRAGTANTIANTNNSLANSSSSMLSHPIDTSSFTPWQNVLGQGSTNLVTHDWTGNVGNGGVAVAGPGTSAANSSGVPGANGGMVSANSGSDGRVSIQNPSSQSAGEPGTQAAQPAPSGADPLAGYFGHASNGPTSDYGAGGGFSGGWNVFQGQGGAGSGSGGSPGGAGASASSSSSTASDPYHVRDSFDKSGITTTLPSTIDDTSRRRVEEALMSRLNPQLQQDESNLRTRLLNSGIEVGTDAYNREFNLQNQKSNDARMQAVLAGGQEEDRQTKLLQGLNEQQFQQALATGKFGQDADIAMANNATSRSNAATSAAGQVGAAGVASQGATDRQRAALAQQAAQFNVQTSFNAAQFNNTLRQQQMEEATKLRQQPLNEMTAMTNLSAPTMPNPSSYFTNTQQAPAAQQGNPVTNAASTMQALNTMWNMEW